MEARSHKTSGAWLTVWIFIPLAMKSLWRVLSQKEMLFMVSEDHPGCCVRSEVGESERWVSRLLE